MRLRLSSEEVLQFGVLFIGMAIGLLYGYLIWA